MTQPPRDPSASPANADSRVAGNARERENRGWGLLSAHLCVFVGLLLALGFSRLGLTLWLPERVEGVETTLRILANGLRMDVLVLSYLSLPAVVLTLLAGGPGPRGRLSNQIVLVYVVVMVVAVFFLELTTPTFIAEYDSRPNRLFIEYLVHPREVSSMLWVGYRGVAVAVLLVTTLVGIAAWKGLAIPLNAMRPASLARRALLLLVIVPLLILGGRSSLQHRPANPSSVAFSSDHLLNDLCLSSIYSLLYASYQIKHERDASSVYGHLESDRAVEDEVRAAMLTVSPDAFTSREIPTLHRQQATSHHARPKNLVIILEESLGAQYVAALGGQPVTRFLDTLATEGWWFDQMYATGTRSVRGIEAVVSGFLPTPARSVVKLGRSQQGFFTLAELLGNQGYRTQFIYGGESHFDNMRRFFTGNGFQEVIDENDFEAPVFHGSWGVSDEDIMLRAHQSFLAAGDQPFFSLVFSVSNHSPWEYPEGRIEPFDAPAATVRNTVRYADHALGLFFDMAREAPYWKDTLFVVIADHDSRVFGASLVPIEHFHIPAVILGDGIAPRRDARLVSQIDLAPTLLSLMGVSSEHPMVGYDLTRLPADSQGRAIMQYGSNQAYLEGRRCVVLQPELQPTEYDWDGESLQPSATSDPALVRRALAHALLPSLLYREQRYRLPEQG